MLNKHFQDIVTQATNTTSVISTEVIESLWSGYGEIVRVGLSDAQLKSVVLKYITFPTETNHPRGWNTTFSHQRKIKSYDVEMHWYRDWSKQCDDSCRVAKCYVAKDVDDECIIVLEDLDAAGFPDRYSSLDKDGAKLCLSWLANFHALFVNVEPEGLWATGTPLCQDSCPVYISINSGRGKINDK